MTTTKDFKMGKRGDFEFSKRDLRIMINVLREIETLVPPCNECASIYSAWGRGLCENISDGLARREPLFSNGGGWCYGLRDYIEAVVWPSWDKFSGSYSYPVPVPESPDLHGVTSEDIFYMQDNKYTGPYGELRRELLTFTIDSLNRELIRMINNGETQ